MTAVKEEIWSEVESIVLVRPETNEDFDSQIRKVYSLLGMVIKLQNETNKYIKKCQ